MKFVALGEIMLRLTPEGYRRFGQADRFEIEFGGAEANVATALSYWGEEAVFVSKVPGNDIGEACVSSLRKNGVDTRFILRGGDRLGLYYLERGNAQRASKVIYDRAGSAFAGADEIEFDWNEIFAGADWFHLTGITPALGEKTEKLALAACKAAKEAGASVSFDVNYRSSLWSVEKARCSLEKLISYADVCITNESQMRELFGLDLPSGGKSCLAAAKYLKEKYGVKYTAFTYRKSGGTGADSISSALSDGSECYASHERAVGTVGRIGGGDAYAAGLIYMMRQGIRDERATEFATAASCLKNTVEGDFCLIGKDEIADLASGKEYYGVKR